MRFRVESHVERGAVVLCSLYEDGQMIARWDSGVSTTSDPIVRESDSLDDLKEERIKRDDGHSVNLLLKSFFNYEQTR